MFKIDKVENICISSWGKLDFCFCRKRIEVSNYNNKLCLSSILLASNDRFHFHNSY